ncbi:unnamed protein product, partial [Staurois parvus]
MQMPVLGCTFLTLSDREESTAENRQLSERGSAPIIRVTDHQCPDDRCLAVPHTSSVQVPSSVPTCATQQCHPPVPISAAQQCCQSVPPVSAQRLCQSVPSSDVSHALQCCLSVPPIS